MSDNGIGISKETIEHIFEPFFTTKKMGKGAGLGLATVYGIVRQNNGFITAYSEPGQGTAFKIYLPRYLPESADIQKKEDDVLKGGTETVLIVEDEEAILKVSRRILEQLGYTVLTAASPAQALVLAREYEGDIHLLVTDVVMPETNGRELVEKLIHIKPGIKCLYMSGYTADVIAHHGVLEQGINFISKPFSIASFAARVSEVLQT